MDGTVATDIYLTSTATNLISPENMENVYRTTLSEYPAGMGSQWTPPEHNVTQAEADNSLYPMIPMAERIVEGTILCIIWILAFLGNLLLWIVVFRRKSLRTVTNAMVLCLSFADLLVSTVNLPFTIVMVIIGKEWVFGHTLCVLLGFINMLTFVASVMSLASIGICRYLFIVHPLKFRKVYNQRNTGFIIAGVWLLAGLLASPPLYGWAVYDYLPGQSFCFCDWKTSVSYTFFMVGICFGGPCSVMTFCYVQILRVVRKSRQRVDSTKRQSMISTASKKAPILKVPSSTGSIKGSRKTLNSFIISTSSASGGSVNSSRPASTADLDDKQVNFTETTTGNNLQVRPTVQHKNKPKATQKQPDDNKSEFIAGHGVDGHQHDQVTSPDGIVSETDNPSSCDVKLETANMTTKVSGNNKSELIPQLSVVSINEDPSPKTEHLPIEEDRPSFLARLSQRGSAMKSMVSIAPRDRRKGKSIDQNKRRRQEELKLTKSFVVVIFAFIICWLPFCVAMFWTVFGKNPPPRIFDMATLILGYSNSCCNPIIYGVMNRKFRAGYKDILLTICTCWKNRKENFKVTMPTSSALGGGGEDNAIFNQAYARDSRTPNGTK